MSFTNATDLRFFLLPCSSRHRPHQLFDIRSLKSLSRTTLDVLKFPPKFLRVRVSWRLKRTSIKVFIACSLIVYLIFVFTVLARSLNFSDSSLWMVLSQMVFSPLHSPWRGNVWIWDFKEKKNSLKIWEKVLREKVLYHGHTVRPNVFLLSNNKHAYKREGRRWKMNTPFMWLADIYHPDLGLFSCPGTLMFREIYSVELSFCGNFEQVLSSTPCTWYIHTIGNRAPLCTRLSRQRSAVRI